jgi:hypothetical protein
MGHDVSTATGQLVNRSFEQLPYLGELGDPNQDNWGRQHVSERSGLNKGYTNVGVARQLTLFARIAPIH